MSGNTWWSTKLGAKLLSEFVIFWMFSSDVPSIRVVPLKYLI